MNIPLTILSCRNITAILNKITPQNFKELSVQIMQLDITTMLRLDQAVELIFEKAVLEPAFSQTYANLCKVCLALSIGPFQTARCEF